MKRAGGHHRRGAANVALVAGFSAILAVSTVIGSSAGPVAAESSDPPAAQQTSFQVVPFREVDGVRTNADVSTRAELDALILSSEPKSITLGPDFEIVEVVIGAEADAARLRGVEHWLEPGAGSVPSYWELALRPQTTH